jgi:hypothetical protein
VSGFGWFVSLEVTGAETQECGCQQPHGAGDCGDAREHEDCFDTQSSTQPCSEEAVQSGGARTTKRKVLLDVRGSLAV